MIMNLIHTGGEMNVIEIAVIASTGALENQQTALECLHKTCKAEYRYSEKQLQKQARDSFILEAADVLGTDATDRWTLSGRILQAVERFKTYRWPRIRAGMYESLSPSERALYRAFVCGAKIPSSQRSYYRLLTLWR